MNRFSVLAMTMVVAMGNCLTPQFSSSRLHAEAPGSAPTEVPPVLLQMIRDDAIHDELDLSQSQRDSVIAALPSIDEVWFRARNLPVNERRTTITELTAKLQSSLTGLLEPTQLKRLAQLQRQALGTRMVMRDDVVSALGLSKKQQERFAEIAAKTDEEAGLINKRATDGKIEQGSAGRMLAAVQKKEREQFVTTLTPTQRGLLGKLTGRSFDFSLVKRMYPLAPEFKSDGVTWIQGGPVSLSELRGKVVAVHFYAFQCINCQRNFPHYKAWHKDYADKDLVVIGIQTPETSSERSLDRVTAAAKSDGFEFPVMMDADSENWKSWSNTMWPTVYLIDKKGFLRRWWQGEMNWKGTPGEQQMRETVEMLLAEEG